MDIIEFAQLVCNIHILVYHASHIINVTFVECELSDPWPKWGIFWFYHKDVGKQRPQRRSIRPIV